MLNEEVENTALETKNIPLSPTIFAHINCISAHGHRGDPAGVDILEHILENARADGVTENGVHNRSIQAGTCVVGKRIHGDEDRAEGLGAFLGALVEACHHACAYRDAYGHTDLQLGPSWRHHRRRRHLSQLDSFHCAYQLPFRSTAFLQQKVAVVDLR